MAKTHVIAIASLRKDGVVLVNQKFLKGKYLFHPRSIAVPGIPHELFAQTRLGWIGERDAGGIVVYERTTIRQVLEPHLSAVFFRIGGIFLRKYLRYRRSHGNNLIRR